MKGFTLVEILVVVGIMVILLAGVMGAMTGTFKAQTSVNLSSKVVQNGNYALTEIRRNILDADGNSIDCPLDALGIGGSSISLNNSFDGNQTILVCKNNKIASESARESVDLTSSEVIIDCKYFIQCEYDAQKVTAIIVNLNVAAGTTQPNYLEKSFSTKISVRN